MSIVELVGRAFEAFKDDLEIVPPLSLRGGYAVDGYDRAEPFDPTRDEPTDGYLEGFAFWGLIYLDAQSWRHYLPRLIDYAARHPDDPAMVTAALVQSLRPPDRYPPRLATLSREQEAIVTAWLERLASDAQSSLREEAQQALDEWWGPTPRSRPSADDIAAARQVPARYSVASGDRYRLRLPDTLAGSGLRDIPEESRRVETWAGYLCGDAHTVVAVNVTPLRVQSLADAASARSRLYRHPVSPRRVDVVGARRAERIDGLTHGDSPAEPHVLTMILAELGDELVTLSIRTWPRDDLARIVEQIVASFEVHPPAA